jgi:hypothetical protein
MGVSLAVSKNLQGLISLSVILNSQVLFLTAKKKYLYP